MPKENDLEGQQDRGGKHGGQAGMPKPEQPPPGQKPATRSEADKWLVTRSRGGRHRDLNETRLLCEHPNDATISGQFGVCGFGYLPPRHATLNYRWCLINLENAH